MSTSNHLPMLKECCCGCTLKTGTMIIGFLSLVTAVISSSITIVSLSTLQRTKKNNNILDIALDMVVITVRIVQILLSILLIVGSHKERSNYVCPWLILSLLMVLIESTFLFLMACELIVGLINAQIFSLASHISITVYFMLVVFSYYRELQYLKTVPATQGRETAIAYNVKSRQVENI